MFLAWSIITMGIPVGFYLSNNQASFFVTTTPLTLEVGYPRTSLVFGSESYLKMDFQESTPTVSAEISACLFDDSFLSFSLAERSEFGQLSGAIQNEKIEEIGRNFAIMNVGIQFFEAKWNLGYYRFYSSVNKNVSKNIFFFAPPNYKGKSPNSFFLKIARSFVIVKNYHLTLLFNGNICFSDSFVFSNPSLEIGVSLFTTTEELQGSF